MRMRLRSHAMDLQNIPRVSLGSLAALCLILFLPAVSYAWQANEEPAITLDANEAGDAAIERRLERIYAEIAALERVDVSVRQGIVFLSGETATDAAGDRAVSIARRVSGVVTVEDRIERTLDIEGNVSPFVLDTQQFLTRLARSWPVYAIVIAVFCLIVLTGHLLASWSGFWNRVAPNPFLGRLLSQTVRVLAFVVAVFAALGMLGATALLGALAGVAGIIGLALGFAVRDTIENYIASILLSVRQPFRASDHVVINEHEGVVVRLTSRATVLMTLDGNHLRIPNAEVFKGVILNYTRNPERRFEFELGVDAEDDPVAAMDTGLKAITRLDFVLGDPAPNAVIVKVGDSSIVLSFTGWVDQTDTDFLKARSLAIRAAKTVLEEDGFTLPEPIYRLRFDAPVGEALKTRAAPAPKAKPPRREPVPQSGETTDVTPDRYLERKVIEERAERDKEDLLDRKNPVE
jgi:small-conductance mechanosensitive channel